MQWASDYKPSTTIVIRGSGLKKKKVLLEETTTSLSLVHLFFLTLHRRTTEMQTKPNKVSQLEFQSCVWMKDKQKVVISDLNTIVQ